RYTPQGTAVANFSLAVDAGKDHTDWFEVVVWREQAENVAQHVKKGQRVAVSGRLSAREYTTKEGQKRKVVEVVASWVDFLEPRSGGARPAGNNRAPADEDDVPF
ncbi:MAG: single-stranded DNA-binding protein, partial [Acidimicrobiales bacterium]